MVVDCPTVVQSCPVVTSCPTTVVASGCPTYSSYSTGYGTTIRTSARRFHPRGGGWGDEWNNSGNVAYGHHIGQGIGGLVGVGIGGIDIL
ncbi:hypothetical protein GCM10022226_31330 [Sphaerisporangium flaviroseum]|uniref:Uncharacterized protein n=1 Tax=Sphaerisporangium flaviroseum TaxID=509199 RepID=A0ABP7I0J7_9ACTN